MYGGYKYLEGGSAIDALRDLTGSPISRFEFADQSTQNLLKVGMLWRLIKDFLNKKSFVVCGSSKPLGLFVKEDNTEVMQTETGASKPNQIFKGLTFSVIEYREVKVGAGQVNLLKVWDQWDQINWRGRYSVTSALWSD